MFDIHFLIHFSIAFILGWSISYLVSLFIEYLLRRRNCKIVKSEGFESLANYVVGGNCDDETRIDPGRI